MEVRIFLNKVKDILSNENPKANSLAQDGNCKKQLYTTLSHSKLTKISGSWAGQLGDGVS